MRINSSFIARIIFAAAKTIVCLGAITVINPIASATRSQSAPLQDGVRNRWVASLGAKKISVIFKQVPIVQVLESISQKSGVPIQALLLDKPAGSVGIDPAITIDLEIKDMRALEVLEIVLRQACDVSQNECRWQTTPSGIEVGPKSRLLRPSAMERRVYMVADLGFKVADFQPPPLQSGGTGGGTAPPPFTPSQQDARYQKLKSLIQATVETDVWAEPSGGPCTIAIFNNTMIVIAPDFVHRSIAGNPLVRATTSPTSQSTH